VVAALGCASAPGQVGSDDENALTAKAPSYVSVRRDERMCPAPLCGGYFIHDLNRMTPDQYVSSLDVSALGWSDDDRARMIGDFEDDALVLKGTLGPRDESGQRALLVTEAYRGMPGVRADATHAFYTMSYEDDEDYYDADKLNTSWSGPCDAVGLDAVQAPLLDRTWLGDKALHGAIVAGNMDNRRMSASQVFVRLPDRAGPCPYFLVPKCEEGQVLAYTRTAQRCLVPSQCVTPAICPLFVPTCASGYRRVSWMSPSACSAHACDPTFVDQ
jgi:hypothetical protein